MFQWCFNEPLGVRHEPFCEASLNLYSPLPFWHDGLVVGDNICGRSRGQPLFTLPCSCLVAEWNYQDVWPSWLDTRWTTGVAWHHGRWGEVGLFGRALLRRRDVGSSWDWSMVPQSSLCIVSRCFEESSYNRRCQEEPVRTTHFLLQSSFQLQDVDYVAAMVSSLARGASARGLSMDLLVKTFDFSKAYKQVAVLPEHHKHATVGFLIKSVWQFYPKLVIAFWLRW